MLIGILRTDVQSVALQLKSLEDQFIRVTGSAPDFKLAGGLGDPPLINHLVYFIRNTRTGSYKIGISENPKKRLSELQVANEDTLEIAATIANAGVEEEKLLHANWGYLRLRGEWFASDKALDGYVRFVKAIEEIRSTSGPESISTIDWFSQFSKDTQNAAKWFRLWLLSSQKKDPRLTDMGIYLLHGDSNE